MYKIRFNVFWKINKIFHVFSYKFFFFLFDSWYIMKYLLIETSWKQYVLWTLQWTENNWNATCRQTCNAWMKPNFMSRHACLDIKSREFNCAIFPLASFEHASWSCFVIKKGFFAQKTNHVFEINTTTVNFRKFSASFQKIQSVCFYYRAYRLREQTETTRQVWLHISGRR